MIFESRLRVTIGVDTNWKAILQVVNKIAPKVACHVLTPGRNIQRSMSKTNPGTSQVISSCWIVQARGSNKMMQFSEILGGEKRIWDQFAKKGGLWIRKMFIFKNLVIW